ncbi:MAG: CPBP family intramembrane metalloprotease [Betaproteobacteria bacterium]|nr:CPBP family intramembrane metalloprotease [Betaproteobacteria bacterium]
MSSENHHSRHSSHTPPGSPYAPVAALLLAAALWGLMFSPWTAPHIDFWLTMSGSALALAALGLKLGGNWRGQWILSLREIAIGVVSAALLWLIFYCGHFFSTLLFSFARPQVGLIYAIKGAENPWMLAALLLFLIGPAEEIFWRGFLQRRLAAFLNERNDKGRGELHAWLLGSLAYALVHLWAFNFMLLGAALVCGLFWGALYRWRKNLVPVLVSHALWDVAIFILFPVV